MLIIHGFKIISRYAFAGDDCSRSPRLIVSQSVAFDTSKELQETRIEDKEGVFRGIGVTATDAGRFVDFDAYKPLAVASAGPGAGLVLSARRETLHFVPFYYRANRGGRGQMRVGLRRA